GIAERPPVAAVDGAWRRPDFAGHVDHRRFCGVDRFVSATFRGKTIHESGERALHEFTSYELQLIVVLAFMWWVGEPSRFDNLLVLCGGRRSVTARDERRREHRIGPLLVAMRDGLDPRRADVRHRTANGGFLSNLADRRRYERFVLSFV